MITNVQILTEDDEVIHVVVESDKKVTAAYQDLRTVPTSLIDNYGYWMETLDLSHNKIRDVVNLETAFKLHTLILDDNLLSSDVLFPWMPGIRVLWLNNNLILSLQDFIPALSRSCPNLVYLSLMGNRAAASTAMGGSENQQDKYRLFVISHFKYLRHLDDKPVTTIERLRCERRDETFMDNIFSLYNSIKDTFKMTLNLGRNPSGVV